MIPLRDNIPSKTFPIITWAIILANCAVFYLQLTAGIPDGFERFVFHWGVVPSQLFAEPVSNAHRLITAAFLHGGWMHIIGNMVYLYIFGDNVEDRMGHFRFLLFYLIAGALANFSQAYFSASSTVPLIGASGAIAGVLGSYFFYYPHARVVTLLPIFIIYRIVEVPAFFFLGFWFILQAMNSAYSIGVMMSAKQNVGGVAWLAHAGGFVVGIILSPMFAKKRGRFK